jgi:hypothetical protein
VDPVPDPPLLRKSGSAGMHWQTYVKISAGVNLNVDWIRLA